MGYNLRFEEQAFGGYVPFIDSAHKAMIRGGITVDAAWCRNNRIESQGQVVIRDNRHWLVAGSILCQQGANGLWRVYTPTESAVAATLLIGGHTTNSGVLLTAAAAGAAGNDIRFGLTSDAPASSALAVTVIGNKIEVKLQTTGGNITTDADALVAAIIADTAASALVTAATAQTLGTGVMEGMDFENLDGGSDAVNENAGAANDVALLWEDVDIQDGNAVTTGLDHGRVIENRLPIIDAAARNNMPHIKFIEK